MHAYTSASRVGRVLLAVALVTAPAVAGAQATAPGAKIELQDAIAIALRQSVLVKQSENALASSTNGVSQARNAFLPSLALSTSSARSVGRAGTSTIGSSTSQSLNTGLSSSLTVFDGLRNIHMYAEICDPMHYDKENKKLHA